jgi:exopolysaccharide biosynthesis operon protein EpsL
MMTISANARYPRRPNATSSWSKGLVVLALLFAASDVLALGSDTVFISGSAGVSYDSNLYRLDTGIDPTTPNSHRSDTIYNVGVGLAADVPYSRQRFQANLNVNDYKYSENTDLDYVGVSGRGAWLWTVGDDFNGDLGISLAQSLQNYSYTSVSTQRNVVRTANAFFDPRYRLAPNLELQAGLSYQIWRNTLDAAKANDYNLLSGRLGLAYVTRSGNSVGLQVEKGNATFPNQAAVGFDNGYDDARVSTFYNWRFSGASAIDGSFGYKQRNHNDPATQVRDFSGWTGSVGWSWAPTGRTSARFSLARDIGGVDDLVITYARTYTLSAIPSYQLTGKISLNGLLQFQDLRFFGNTGFLATTTTGTLAGRHDKILSFGAGGSYLVTRVFSLDLNYRFERRNSNVPQGSYNDNIITFNGHLTF